MENIRTCVFANHNVLILGQAGTGKTELIKDYANKLRKQGKTVQITAPTGIAALNVNGITVHKFAGLLDGRFTDDELLTYVNTPDQIHIKERIQKTDVLFIDEISMISAKLFFQMELLCRRVRHNDSPFGGIQIIGAGDFFQLKPVPSPLYGDAGTSLTEVPEAFAKVFPHHFVLKDVHRQKQGNETIKFYYCISI